MRGVAYGLGSAVLFGVSAPLAKLLLPGINPILFAGLLYLGAGVGLSAVRVVQRTEEAPLQRSDWPRVLGTVLLGGLLGPILLMVGLTHLSGVPASLLLNLEAPLTILIAVFAFHDHLGAMGGVAVAILLAGSALVAGVPGHWQVGLTGVASVVGACVAWAVDNNLSERLSLRDPVAVVRAKALGAGTLATALGLVWSPSWPSHLGWILLLGFFCYGMSAALHVRAQRELGAARQAALFSSAPFIGALASILLLHERLTSVDILAGGVMAVGMFLLLKSRHAHPHAHDGVDHEHLHSHDEHHLHGHVPSVKGPHSHPHRHIGLTHDHPHVPDLHHHHRH